LEVGIERQAMSTDLTFSSWLRQRRTRLGVTQDELSDQLGFSPAMLRKIESGERRPSGQIASSLAIYFRIPTDEREAFIAFARTGQATAGPDESASKGASPLRPWRAAYVRRTNLPTALTPIIGREKELEAAHDLLLHPKTRLLTITGTAGIGKTRLALQVASGLLDQFEDGTYFVDLAPVADPEAVLPTVAQTLGLGEDGGRSVETLLLGYVRERRMLFVLDNFEQVLDAAASLVTLMQASPWLKALVTSREALHVRGERRFPVPPLAVPNPRDLPSLQVLAHYPSVELFVERAQEVAPGFVLDADNAEDVAALCAGLEGLPIAIELAASRANHLTPAEMRHGLANPLELLTGGGRDVPARHRTIRGAIEWSYNLLDTDEQRLFRCLGVFVGGFTPEAVTDVYEHEPGSYSSASDGLLSLADKHLVREEKQTSGPDAKGAMSRFSLLEAIREYSVEKMEQDGEAAETRHRHALYYLSLAEKANAHFIGPQSPGWGAEQILWVDRLEGELGNMRAALDWYQARAEDDQAIGRGMTENLQQGLRLTTALGRVWFGHGHVSEGLERTMALLAMVPKPVPIEPPRLRAIYAAALIVAGRLAPLQGGDISGVRSLIEESIRIADELGDKQLEARSLLILGSVALSQGDYLEARVHEAKCLELFRELGNKWGAAAALQDLGEIEIGLGELPSAQALLEESLALYLAVGEEFGAASAQASLGHTAYCRGEYEVARLLFEESLQMSRKIGYTRVEGYTLVMSGWASLREGSYERARGLLSDELIRSRELGPAFSFYWSLIGLGVLGALRGTEREARSAALLFGAADALHADRRIQLSPAYQVELHSALSDARARLPEEEWDAAWKQGRAMSPEEAVMFVLGHGTGVQRARQAKW
jgi:predicted ATPase/DNA-binding XRE family transcriptional regulator